MSTSTIATAMVNSKLTPFCMKTWRRTVIVKNDTQLKNALTNAQLGDRIIIYPGTYTLDKQYTIPNCTIRGFGDKATTIQDYGFNFNQASSVPIDIKGINFDARAKSISNRDFIILNNGSNANISYCTFKDMGNATWNSTNIRITKTDSSSYINIYRCNFTGNNNVTNFGHTNAAIGGYQLANAYNVFIYNNTFNHNSGGYSPLRNAKAIAFLNDRNNCTLNNCMAYNNTYSSNDSNYGITESTFSSQVLFDDTASSSNLSSKYNYPSTITYYSTNTSYRCRRGAVLTTKNSFNSRVDNIKVSINCSTSSASNVNHVKVRLLDLNNNIISEDMASITITKTYKYFYLNCPINTPFKLQVLGVNNRDTSVTTRYLYVFNIKIEEYNG